MKQRIFNMNNKKDIKDLFELFRDDMEYITCDNHQGILLWKSRPRFNENSKCWEGEGKECDLNYLKINFNKSFIRDCIIQRPINYEDWIGKWGVFANQEENLDIQKGNIGCLEHYGDIDDNGIYIGGTVECSMFYCRNRNEDGEEGIYEFFRLLTQEEKQQIMEN